MGRYIAKRLLPAGDTVRRHPGEPRHRSVRTVPAEHIVAQITTGNMSTTPGISGGGDTTSWSSAHATGLHGRIS